MTQGETVRRIMADSGLAAETVQNSPLAGRASATTSVHSEAMPNPAFTCSPLHLPEGPALGHTGLPGALRIITTQK